MEEFVERLARGNVTEVKVVLASVLLALAAYQLVLIAVGYYGKLRPPFLAARPASAAHRASGDAIVVLVLVVAVMCLSYFGFEEGGLHVVAGTALLVVLGLKIAVLRRLHRLNGLLPVLGISVFVLVVVTWLTSAGDFLADT